MSLTLRILSLVKQHFALPANQRVCLRVSARTYVAAGPGFGFHREVIKTDELEDANYTANGPTRCFFCKDELYEKLEAVAASARDCDFIVDGSTCDDLDDYRPGRVATSKHGVRSPLIEVEMSKAEVRTVESPGWTTDLGQTGQSCLSSRIAYGIPVTIERLSTVDRGEEILRELGFREFRVRHHDSLVRLEILRQR